MNKYLLIFFFIILSASSNSFYVSAQNYEIERSLTTHKTAITYLCLRSEDNLLISGSKDGQIMLWNIENGENLHTLSQHTKQITHLEFSPNGQHFLSASYDGTIKVWDVSTGNLLKTYQSPSFEAYANVNGNEPTFATFSPDGKSIYFGGYNAQITKIDWASDRLTKVYEVKNGGISCGIFSEDGRFLIFASLENIYFLNTQTLEIQEVLKKSSNIDDYICEIAVMPEKSLLAAWTYKGELQFWDYRNKTKQFSITATEQKGTSSIAFSNDENLLLTGNDGDKIKLWNLESMPKPQILKQAHQAEVTCFAFSADNQYIVSGSNDSQIHVWKVPIVEQETQSSTTENLFPHIPQQIAERETNLHKTVSVKSKEVEIQVWDKHIVDGDSISLNWNGEWVLQHHALKKKKKTIKVKLNEKNNYLAVHAHNEGTNPPNTVTLLVKDKKKIKYFNLKSSLTTSQVLNFVYEEKK